MFPGNDIVSSLIAVQMGGTGGGTIAVPDIINYFLEKAPECEVTLIPGYTAKLWIAPDGMFYTWDNRTSIYWNSDNTEGRACVDQKIIRAYIIIGVFHGDTLMYIMPQDRSPVKQQDLYNRIDATSFDVYRYVSYVYDVSNYRLTNYKISTDGVVIRLLLDYTRQNISYDKDGNITNQSTTEAKDISKNFNIQPYPNFGSGNQNIYFSNLTEKQSEAEALAYSQALIDYLMST